MEQITTDREEATTMNGMTGTYAHTMDAKGRLFIPAKLREELGDVFYLMVGTDKCLTLYPQASWDQFCERLSALDSVQADMLNVILGNTVRCEPDSQGRIQIPQYLRDYAGLKKNVVISGHVQTAKLWDEEEWNKRLVELTPQNVAALMKSLGI
jgi:MraZ protein